MGMNSLMPLGSSGVSDKYSSYDVSEDWTNGVCNVHVLSMVLSLDLTVG